MKDRFKFRNFKTALILTSMIFGLTGCSNIKEASSDISKENDVTYNASDIIDIETKDTEVIDIETIDAESNENVDKVINYIQKNYFKNISREDIGCATQTSNYLYKNDGEYHFDINSYDRLMNGDKRYNDDGDVPIYVFTDNTNGKRPIAGILKKDGVVSNVVIDSIDLIDDYVIKRDSNKYVNFSGSIEEMNNFFEGAEAYFEERKQINKKY